jgi:ornithine carbamoyltransferase
MGPTLIQRPLPAGSALSALEMQALLDGARALQQAEASGQAQRLLRGKNLGLLCADAAQADAVLFRRAATDLGARVAHVAMSLSEGSSAQDVTHTARMLGRLYDAVECQGMAPTVVQGVAAEAGVAVYDGVATPGHPTAHLAYQLDHGIAPADKRRYVLQALLLHTIV